MSEGQSDVGAEPLVEVAGLHKSYHSPAGPLHVLKGLDLVVREGEMIAITGVSGSGKSTLLHILGGMDRADSGSVSCAGRRLQSLSGVDLAAFRNREVGFVFQFHHLLPEFSALENTAFPLWLRRDDRRHALEEARHALDSVGLADRLHHRPGELSGGEQQRVAMARALVGRPRLVLADEPTGNLDPATAAAVHTMLRTIQKERSLTVVLVTHNEELARLADTRRRMEGGRLE
ncbi:MAG: ABC transporter ATP-binding protein [Acidobacteriota bacterium]